MKALTLHQPYASLIIAGVKKAETRGWKPPRGASGRKLAIHAAKKKPLFETDFLEGWDIPTGAVLGHATLKAYCRVAKYSKEAGMFIPDTDHHMFFSFWPHMRNQNIFFKADQFGDYSEGRWIWYLDEVVRYKTPIPTRGWQGLWEFDSPYDPK